MSMITSRGANRRANLRVLGPSAASPTTSRSAWPANSARRACRMVGVGSATKIVKLMLYLSLLKF